MKTLTLLRHAKSSWANSDQADFDRPLNDRGLRDAPLMSQRLVDQGCRPDFILCSAAHRTRQTAEYFLAAFELQATDIDYRDELYLASAGTLLAHIQSTGTAVEHVMIIGHNPGLEVLGRQLHPRAPAQMPTCAVTQFAIHNDSFEIAPDTQIDLVQYDFPKNAA